jgi:putative membrane protein
MKFLVKVIITGLAIYLISALMPGVEVKNLTAAVLVSVLIMMLNVFVKPLLIFLTLPITVVTLGLFLLVINAVIILCASYLFKEGFQVDGFWVALLFSIVLSMTNSITDRIIARLSKDGEEE